MLFLLFYHIFRKKVHFIHVHFRLFVPIDKRDISWYNVGQIKLDHMT